MAVHRNLPQRLKRIKNPNPNPKQIQNSNPNPKQIHLALLQGEGDDLDHVQQAGHARLTEILPHKVVEENLVFHKLVWVVGESWGGINGIVLYFQTQLDLFCLNL